MNRVCLLPLLLALTAGSALASPPAAPELVGRSQQAFYSAGSDMTARVTMVLSSAGGGSRTRVLTMLRRNGGASGEQKYFLFFHSPGDVRRTAFLVWKYAERDDDRWIFIPAVNLVRRVAARDSRSSFVGSDFTYEDISGRDVSADTHTLAGEERVGDADCTLVQSVPRGPAEYARKLAWIAKQDLLPRKEEYFDARGKLLRRFTSERIEVVRTPAGKEYPTVTKRTMTNLQSGHSTEVTFAEVAYDVGTDDASFTERSLRSPPQKWVR